VARVCLRRGFRAIAEKVVLKRETKVGGLGFLALALASSFMFLEYGIIGTFFNLLNVCIITNICGSVKIIQLYH